MSNLGDILHKLKQDPESVPTSELINELIIMQLEKFANNEITTVSTTEVAMNNLIKLLEIRE